MSIFMKVWYYTEAFIFSSYKSRYSFLHKLIQASFPLQSARMTLRKEIKKKKKKFSNFNLANFKIFDTLVYY